METGHVAGSGPHQGWNPRARDREWVALLSLLYWPPHRAFFSCAKSLSVARQGHVKEG